MSWSPSQDVSPESNAVSKFCLQYKSRIFLSLFYFFFETSFSFKMFFFPVYWQQLGLSPTQIGILRAFWGVAYSVGAVLFGQLANKWHIRRALLLMSIFSTVLTPLVSLIPQRSHDKCFDYKPAHTINQSHPLSDAFARGHPHPYPSLQEPGSGEVEKMDTTRGNAEAKFFGYDPGKLISKRFSRQLQYHHEEHSVLEKSQEDINTIFIIFIFIVFIGELLSSPAFNLANSEIVEFLGENSREFGKIRLWGPIGHMIAAPTTAVLVTHFHYVLCGEYQDNFAIAFIVIALMASCAFVSVTQLGSVKTTGCSGIKEEGDDETPMTLAAFFARYQNLIFIIMTFLVGCFDGVVLTFGFWYTKTLDATVATLVFGFSRMTCSAVSVVFLSSIGMCVKKTGYTGVTIFSMLLFVSWFVGMSFMKNPWFMLIFETIGYVAYAVGFTGFISYFGEVTPSHLTDTVQGRL